MTLPIWVLEVVAFAALSLIWLAVLLCIADAVGGALKRRSERRRLDRLWDDNPEAVVGALHRLYPDRGVDYSSGGVLDLEDGDWKVRR